MRLLTIGYTIAAICLFGWLAGIFDFISALFCSVIFALPAAFAWRLIIANRPITRREYGYMAILTTFAVTGTGFLVADWFATGQDRLAAFEREYHTFREHISKVPEFKNVEISYTQRKGGRVYLYGTVASKDSHDRLIQMIKESIRNNGSGYFDGVTY